MLQDIMAICKNEPHILVFLSLAIGYFTGKIKIFGFALGSTTCVLLASLVLGQVGVEIPDILKNISFALFTFCIGYKVGPQFFGALKKEGIKYIWVAVVVAVVALATTLAYSKMLKLNKGTSAGLFAGSVTQSAAIGTAEGAIKHLPLPEDKKTDLDTNVAVAYAITYIFGTAGSIVFLKMIPQFWKISLKDEARKLEAQMSGGAEEEAPSLFSWTNRVDLRAYRLTSASLAGKTVNEIEASFPTRVAVDRIKRGDKTIATAPETKVLADDIVVVMGRRQNFIGTSVEIGPEIDPADVVDMIGETLEVCVLNKRIVGKTLGQISKYTETHGLFLTKATRQGYALPVTRDTVVHNCDIFHIVGAKEDIERAVKFLGYAERPTEVTDLVMVGIGCVLGTLIGLIAVPLAGIPITLGIGGGVLVAGLVFGWLRSMHPTFGQIPSGGQWILMNLGLNLFVACVGLAAGSKALQAFETTGLSVFIGGVLVSLLPMVAGLAVGRSILKMNPVLLLGAVAGARVCTAALNMLQEEAGNATPVLGYAVPYAFGNVLLIIWGTIIVNVV